MATKTRDPVFEISAPGEPVRWLNQKYRVGGTAPRHNKHSDNQGRNRHKVKGKPNSHVQRVLYMPDAYNGHTRMISYEEYLELLFTPAVDEGPYYDQA